MASSAQASNEDGALAAQQSDKKLHDIFLEGWNGYEELEQTSLPFNSSEFQSKVKASIEHFELATRIVSDIGMFSSNELIDEVSTESLQFLLLPFFLGKLILKISNRDRKEVLDLAQIYFQDYLQRCADYELCETGSLKKTLAENSNKPSSNNEMAQLMQAAVSRNDKIAQFRRKKELDEHIKLMKVAVQNSNVDEEIKRDFFLKFLQKNIIEAKEELDSLKLEQQMVDMHKMHLQQERNGSANANDSHAHHGHSHGPPKPKSKPMQPFIITRNATQKAVFGMGYPSMPVMTVDEFYTQRVQEGIFPDEEKVAKMNAAQAIAAAQNENEKEDQEKAAEELLAENDDEEYRARMQRMDEYKDVVRRGDGNRHNRS